MSKHGESSKGRIYGFFTPLGNKPHCDEEPVIKFQKVDPKENTATTLQGVAPQYLDPTTSNLEDIIEVYSTTIFERDSGLCRQIWEYPKEKMNDVRREYLKMGPYHWSTKDKDYPLSKGDQDSQFRRFKPEWFERFSWFEYSPSHDRAYCFACFLFGKNPPSCKAYTSIGFKGWKRISKGKDCAFSQQVEGPCSLHMVFVSSCEDLMNPSRKIDNIMCAQSKEVVMKNRLLVEETIKCVKWLVLQGCAFRGHDESPSSENYGNFMELLKFMGEINEEMATVIMTHASRNAIYTSPDIQKEVLHLLAENVRKQIREEVGDAKFFVLVDEAQDVSNHEQIVIILRFVDGGGLVRERIFAIIGVEDTNASTLKKKIFSILAHRDLNTCNLRGQGYDGASNMRSAWNGLQSLISKECPQAYYVHWFAHHLQPALVGASDDAHEVWLFFSKLTSIVNFVNVSPKRKTELEALHISEIKKIITSGELETRKGANQMTTLQKGGLTRWSSHFASVRSLIEIFSTVGIFLQGISTDGSTNCFRGEARGDYVHMRSFEFVFLLHLMHQTMGLTNLLCKYLQEKSQNILHVMELVSSTKQRLQDMREEGWDTFLASVLSFCDKHDVIIPDMSAPYDIGSGRSCSQKDCITLEHHYHFDIFIGVIEHQVMELKNMFNEEEIELLTISSALGPHDGFRSFNIDDIFCLAEKFYPQYFDGNEVDTLRDELEHYKMIVVECPQSKHKYHFPIVSNVG